MTTRMRGGPDAPGSTLTAAFRAGRLPGRPDRGGDVGRCARDTPWGPQQSEILPDPSPRVTRRVPVMRRSPRTTFSRKEPNRWPDDR